VVSERERRRPIGLVSHDRRRRRRGAGASLTCAGMVAATSVLAAHPSSAVPAAPLQVPESAGSVTLGELSGTSVILDPKPETASQSFELRMPEGATQGPDTWYLIRLDVSLTFSPDTPPGSVLVSAFVNGQATAQVEFYAERGSRGRPVTRWNSGDYIHGPNEGRFRGRTGHVQYANYLPFGGVRPGLADFTVEAERFGGAKAEEIEIGPSSGIYATEVGPVDLEVTADLSDDELRIGESSRLEVEVTNRSSRVAKDVQVVVLPQSKHLFVDGPNERSIAAVDGSARTEFTIGRNRAGKLRVGVVAVASNGSEASTSVEAQVWDQGGGAPWWAVVAAAVLGLCGVAAARRARKGGEVGS
jgi:hypothetical protein